jgi:hypothetical protein
MKLCGEWIYTSTISLPRYYLEVRGQLHTSAALLPVKEPHVINWIRECVGPRIGLDYVEGGFFFSINHPTITLYICDNMSVVILQKVRKSRSFHGS